MGNACARGFTVRTEIAKTSQAHLLTWMMAATYPTRSRGTLTYRNSIPETRSHQPAQLFCPRRSRPGKIRIQPVQPKRRFFAKTTRDLAVSQVQLRTKLAISRENARRFLKSVIASNSDSSSQTSNAQDKRRSWSPTKRQQSVDGSASGAAASTSNMRSNFRNSIAGPVGAQLHRPRLNSDSPSLSAASSRVDVTSNTSSPRMESRVLDNGVIPQMSMDDEKPVAAGNGVSMGIHLAEPVLFLQGFDNNEAAPGNTAMLRGGLHIRVQKATKIKAITLKFRGVSITKWPEGIPPKKTEFEEKDTLMSHTWPFFNAQFENAERGTNADHVQLFKGSDGASTTITRLDSPSNSTMNLSSKEAKKLALSVNQSRSFGKGDPAPGPSVAAKGYRTFLPGDYLYNFELPLDSRLPETIDVELGSVKYELEASVERSGAFRSNLVGSKEITLIRAPSEGSLEQVEPIAISRNWEDQLHYDIVISGKSFPLGSQVPIAFKLTPLAKVQCHRIKVLVTENIEYFCSNKRVHRMEPTRKVQLFEKRSDGPPVSTFPGSTMRVVSGGGIPYDQRAAAARGEHVVPMDTTNLLGSLDGEANVGPTEMEFNVQLPSCHTMKDRDRTQRLHFDTTYSNIQVHHWIKIVMRLSKPDANDPTKRRHFEISIDSPFHILSCRATQANISLPAYTMPYASQNGAHLFECGCPGAARRRNSPTSFVPTLNSLQGARTGSDGSIDIHERSTAPAIQPPNLARPPTIHAAQHIGRTQNVERPIHLLRAPSFNPPAFEDEEPPPALITPPPQYDTIASPTHGLSDYFTRLSDAYDSDDGDEASSLRNSGRVNVPLTPGGRVNRSMDLTRSWVPVGGLQ